MRQALESTLCRGRRGPSVPTAAPVAACRPGGRRDVPQPAQPGTHGAAVTTSSCSNFLFSQLTRPLDAGGEPTKTRFPNFGRGIHGALRNMLADLPRNSRPNLSGRCRLVIPSRGSSTGMSRDAYLAVSQGGNLAASFGACGTPMTIRRRRTGAMQRHDLFRFCTKANRVHVNRRGYSRVRVALTSV